MSWGSPAPGDWVRTTRSVQVGTLEQLRGGGSLAKGRLGVVTDTVGWNHVTVEFDGRQARLSRGEVRVVRRGGGQGPYQRRGRAVGLARLAVALVLAFPFVSFSVRYVMATRSTDGLVGAFAVGALQAMLDSLAASFNHPLHALLYFSLLSVLTKFAFRR